jgi:hypothetical protein
MLAVGMSIALLGTLLAAWVPTQTAHAATTSPAPLLAVQDNQLIDTRFTSAQPITLRGVNRSGTEYACIQGWGIFDGPSDDASIKAMLPWKINAVRVPLNEDCWLGINRVKDAYSGIKYRSAIADYVSFLNANGLVAILDLHWSAPGKKQATGQQPMPDRDHSVTFWTQVADAYKGNLSVAFDLFNEPSPDSNQNTTAAWQCWRDGGRCSGVHFTAAGMLELVTAVRNAGASNVILLGGVQFSNALYLSQTVNWLTYKPAGNNLVAAWHAYDFNPCNTTSCWNTNVAPVALQVPVVTGEFGEKNQGPQFVWGGATNPAVGLLPWLDQRGIGYVGWTWDAWNSWDSLITDYNGNPNSQTYNGMQAYGQAYHDYLATLP